MDRQIVVYSYNNKLLSSNKKELTIDIDNDKNKSQSNCADWKKSNRKEYIVYDSIKIKFNKMQTLLVSSLGERDQLTLWGLFYKGTYLYHEDSHLCNLGGTAAAAAQSLQLCPTLCNPIDGSPPGSAVLGILLFKVFIEFVTILLLLYVLVFLPPGMWDLRTPTRDQTWTPCIGSWSPNHWTTRHYCFLTTAPGLTSPPFSDQHWSGLW